MKSWFTPLPLALQLQRLQRWLFDRYQPANFRLQMPVSDCIRKHDKPPCNDCVGCNRLELAQGLNMASGAKQALGRVELSAKAVGFA